MTFRVMTFRAVARTRAQVMSVSSAMSLVLWVVLIAGFEGLGDVGTEIDRAPAITFWVLVYATCNYVGMFFLLAVSVSRMDGWCACVVVAAAAAVVVVVRWPCMRREIAGAIDRACCRWWNALVPRRRHLSRRAGGGAAAHEAYTHTVIAGAEGFVRRKAISMVVSVLFFPKTMTWGHALGATLVGVGIAVNVMVSECARWVEVGAPTLLPRDRSGRINRRLRALP